MRTKTLNATMRSLFGTPPAEPPGVPSSLGEPRLLIDGQLTDAHSGARYPNLNPATEEVVGLVADADAADLDGAIAAARRAFEHTSWRDDHALRATCVQQLREALTASADELRYAMVAEVGCTLGSTYGEQVDGAIDKLRFLERTAREYPYEQPLASWRGHGRVTERVVRREPYGVVGAITPWNFPLDLNLAKVGHALATGNTVVLKPAPTTPWTATIMGRAIAEQTDIPAGVVNVVTSSDDLIGEQLVADPRVDLVTFTGSTATGKRVMSTAAASIKKVVLELGGKSANIVLDDADLSRIVPVTASYACFNAGQGCLLPTRLLLPRSRYDECVEQIKAAYEGLVVGDPLDPETVYGPLNSQRQLDRVLGYVERGLRDGARLLTGGGRSSAHEKGYYVEPTLFVDVDPSMTIAQEEVFGPVLSVLPYEDDDDAVRIANATNYGLAGFVWSTSPERALGVARRLRCGSVGVNGGNFLTGDVPFGGYRWSGIGREWGQAGFEEFLQCKSIAW